MGIGTSLGAYFEDEFSHQAGKETPPEIIKPPDTGDDNIQPEPETRGKYTDVKDKMPFPDNNNPDTDFKNRFGTLPPSGILNDIKPRIEVTPTLIRRVSDVRDEPSTDSTMPPQASGKLTGAFDLSRAPYGTSSPSELPEGSLQGQVLRRQLDETFNPIAWIQKAGKTIHDVATGAIPMSAYDSDTGEMHVSPEGLGAAWSLAPMAVSGGGFPAVIHTTPEAGEALAGGHNAFQEFMATRGRTQPSNIVEQPGDGFQPLIVPETGLPSTHFEHNPTTNEYRRLPQAPATDSTDHALRAIGEVLDHPDNPILSVETPFDGGSHILQGRHLDSLNDEEFYNYGQYHSYGSLTPAQNARWDTLDRAYARQHPEYTPEGERPYTGTEEDLVSHRDFEDHESYTKQAIKEAKEAFVNNPDVKEKGNISLVKTSSGAYGSRDQFNFLSKDGVPGELGVNLKNNGRTIHVGFIGTIGTPGPMDVGHSEMKNLFKLLSEQYPTAEEITGFRVSGARRNSGRGAMDASMRIPGRTQTFDNGPLGEVNAHRY